LAISARVMRSRIWSLRNPQAASESAQPNRKSATRASALSVLIDISDSRWRACSRLIDSCTRRSSCGCLVHTSSSCS